MKKFFLANVFISLSLFVIAQPTDLKVLETESSKTVKADIVDTTKKTWKIGGLYSLSVSQGSLSNWAAGGDDFSLTINSLFHIVCLYRRERISWDNSLDVGFGYLNTTSLGSRKSDDHFDLLSKYGYALNKKLNVTTLFNFRSQFLKGYTYYDTVKTFSSAFLAPGYVLVSLGLDYKPAKNLSIFISPVTSRWVIVKNDSLSAKGSYGVDSGRKSISQVGAFSTINYHVNFNKYVSFITRVDLFSNYKKNPQNIDFNMSNLLTVKLAKFLSINWSVDMIYDDQARLFGKNKTSAALQVKSLIGVGLLIKFPPRA